MGQTVAARISVNDIRDSEEAGREEISDVIISRAKGEVTWNRFGGTDRGNRAHVSILLLLFILIEERIERRFWGAWSSTAEAFVR
jgi:hypothetical protein